MAEAGNKVAADEFISASPTSALETVSFSDWVYVSEPKKLAKKGAMTEKDSCTCLFYCIQKQPEYQSKHLDYHAWIEDLPVCKEFSGVGFTTNQVYKDDGYKHEDHAFEDKCFRIKVSETCFLYGVFDGHCGERAAEFVSQRIPVEILLGQLERVTCDEDVKSVLEQAYLTVEKAYFASIDELVAERTTLQIMLHHGLDEQTVERLRRIDELLASGTSALLVLIKDNRMFVANVGNSRALLVRLVEGILKVEQLIADHSLENESEVQRLADLGLPITSIRQSTMFGQQLYTRCLGDYSVKGGYKDNEQMNSARSEPVIAVPEIEDPLDIDSSCSFLLLMSDGVYRSLVDANATVRVNADIASMVVQEFARQSTLRGVSQAVLDRITRIHHDAYDLAQEGDPVKVKCAVREDMTLLIRNFNHQLRPPVTPERMASSSSNQSMSLSLNLDGDDERSPFSDGQTTANKTSTSNPFFTHFLPTQSTENVIEETIASESYSDSFNDADRVPSVTPLEKDADGRIQPYVNFSEYYDALAIMTDDERERFEKELEPRMDCQTILEVPELTETMNAL